MHNLSGHNRKCNPQNCQGSQLKLCPKIQDNTCFATQFYHDTFLHILPSCTNALESGECFDVNCTLGHDNLEIRRQRAEERKVELAANDAKEKVKQDAITCTQVTELENAMRPKATDYAIHKGEVAATKLQNKMRSKKVPGGPNVIAGPLRNRVRVALKLYDQWKKTRAQNTR
jgi:hypothetical protein